MDFIMPKVEELQDLSIDSLGEATYPSSIKRAEHQFVDDQTKVVAFSTYKNGLPSGDPQKCLPMFEAAGSRKKMYFNPDDKMVCGLITCGGLCPGLNDVIRSIVLTLNWQYGVTDIVGFRYGYAGLADPDKYPPMILNTDVVQDIQNQGGTILGNSRGPQDIQTMIDVLKKYNIRILFAIGGEGTFTGAHELCEEIKRQGLDISVIGVPKTIDNDIYCSEKTFGFSTAVAESRKAIYSAHEEAKAVYNGVGLVKLMGRDSGFIAAHATLANSDVNFCFIPEESFTLHGEGGLLEFLEQRLAARNHAVIVVAEGAGQDLIAEEGKREHDQSGNLEHKDIGYFLQSTIKAHFKEKDLPIAVKYIDPSYMIRSTQANADDSAFCLMLGQFAVHAGMAGKTNMFVGYWIHHFTHVPLHLGIKRTKQVDVQGELWQSLQDALNYSWSGSK